MDVREKLSTEKRLIDADAFLKKMKRTSRYFDVVFDVEEMPTVDAVPVVRCWECKYHKDTSVKEYAHCSLTGYTVEYDDFCSYGEQKMDGDGNG